MKKRVKCPHCGTKYDPLRSVRKYQVSNIDNQVYRISYCPFCDIEVSMEMID